VDIERPIPRQDWMLGGPAPWSMILKAKGKTSPREARGR
jgi:hypothetical protein